MALNLIWTRLTACYLPSVHSRPVFVPTSTSQQDKHAVLRATFRCSFLMGNKSVSTGVDDTRGTPQGAHPFCRGNQRQGSFHRFHYSYLIRVKGTRSSGIQSHQGARPDPCNAEECLFYLTHLNNKLFSQFLVCRQGWQFAPIIEYKYWKINTAFTSRGKIYCKHHYCANQ